MLNRASNGPQSEEIANDKEIAKGSDENRDRSSGFWKGEKNRGFIYAQSHYYSKSLSTSPYRECNYAEYETGLGRGARMNGNGGRI